jgi:tetratricopeptide (TPR) repeat protein
MQAFIVRPFGTKEGINFDRIQEELIKKALENAEILGDTTAAVFEAGNIREDMFQRLLLADLVIADISIPNPNVYYELGIRHALRERQTFMIRAKVTKPKEERTTTDDVPFDIKTDRYLEYDSSTPTAAVEALTQGLKHTRTADRVDSPVFRLLPGLQEPERSRLVPVPLGFAQNVEAATAKSQGGKLGLLGREAGRYLWESGGRRLVALSQFRCKFFQSARESWQAVTSIYPDDLEANLLLGTIHQRLGDLTASDQALRLVLQGSSTPIAERAEALALEARNAKSRGRALWEGKDEKQCRLSALRSGFFFEAQTLYSEAFQQDLNHFYSGLNALGLAVLLLGIIDAERNQWLEMHDPEDEATRMETALRTSRDQLAAVVDLALKSAIGRSSEPDVWRAISVADYKFLTSKKDAAVAAEYEKALGLAQDFHISAARDQLELFAQAGICTERVQACLAVFPATPQRSDSLRHAIVFTGHMVDAPERSEPRFPPSMEGVARKAIRREVQALIESLPGRALGIAGGANGGDILFHEVCAELGIPTRVLLSLPEGPFIAESVAHGGPAWLARFDALMKNHPAKNEVQVLGPDKKLPDWMRDPVNYDIWQRTNLWLMEEAIAASAVNLTLIALWDGKSGDGPGGTKGLVDNARTRGINTILLNTTVLFNTAEKTGETNA